ncbi:hypothetical protein Bbelb_403480 [Branchiostoma belcheri]|nr:hypothetical protein Bbelb_403480 [Branchiostoma belcheri]
MGCASCARRRSVYMMFFLAADFPLCAATHLWHLLKYPDVNLDVYRAKGTPPPFLSYHIHCMFVAYNNDSVFAALKLFDRFIEHFNLTHTRPCEGLYHQGRLCAFDVDYTNTGPTDPFVSANWAIFVPLEWYAKTVPWVMQNRGDQDILVHPNSGAEVSDHTRWALWMGEKWPLNSASFTNQTVL